VLFRSGEDIMPVIVANHAVGGVVGLNGKQYLLDDGGEMMMFDTVEDAKEFIADAGEDPENEYIEYEESE
jgi:hypothetical protein